MATILFNTTHANPIPYYSDNRVPIHNPKGVDPMILKRMLSDYMISMGKSYNLVKENWGMVPNMIMMDEAELLESLIVHSYDLDLFEKYGHKFNQTKLVDCIELNLKNTENYLQAIESFIGLVLNYINNVFQQ